MKTLALWSIFIFAKLACSKNAWEKNISANNLAEIETKRSKTSIIVYDKNKMSDEDVDAEEIFKIEYNASRLLENN